MMTRNLETKSIRNWCPLFAMQFVLDTVGILLIQIRCQLESYLKSYLKCSIISITSKRRHQSVSKSLFHVGKHLRITEISLAK